MNFFQYFSLIVNGLIFLFENQQIDIILFGQYGLLNSLNKINTPFDIIFNNNGCFLVFIFFFIIVQTVYLFLPYQSVDYYFLVRGLFLSLRVADWLLRWSLEIDLEIVWVDDSVLWGLRMIDCSVVRVRVGLLKFYEEGPDLLWRFSDDVVILRSQSIRIQLSSFMVST